MTTVDSLTANREGKIEGEEKIESEFSKKELVIKDEDQGKTISEEGIRD